MNEAQRKHTRPHNGHICEHCQAFADIPDTLPRDIENHPIPLIRIGQGEYAQDTLPQDVAIPAGETPAQRIRGIAWEAAEVLLVVGLAILGGWLAGMVTFPAFKALVDWLT